MDDDKKSHEQPIIIKKIKKGGHGHHGGAWKVAYADFVTAMMAFFIVMWIIASSAETKEQISSYFQDPGAFNFVTGERTIPIDMGLMPAPGPKGNDGEGDGPTNELNEQLPPGVTDSLFKQLKEMAILDSIRNVETVSEASVKISEELQKIAEKDPEVKELLNNLNMQMTPEGLKIELQESAESVYFEVGSSQLTRAAYKVIAPLAREIGKLPNLVELSGHTDSRSYGKNAVYSNWELSADRANAARRILSLNGLWTGQIVSVAGFANSKLIVPENPFDAKNRRVSILVKNRKTGEIISQTLAR